MTLADTSALRAKMRAGQTTDPVLRLISQDAYEIALVNAAPDLLDEIDQLRAERDDYRTLWIDQVDFTARVGEELDQFRRQVERVEALRVWSSDGGLTRRSIRAEHSERGDCVLVEDIEQALAVPAEGGE